VVGPAAPETGYPARGFRLSERNRIHARLPAGRVLRVSWGERPASPRAERSEGRNHEAHSDLSGGAGAGLRPAAAQPSLKKIRVTQAVASFTFLPADYARVKGYFAAEGLDVQQIATRGGGPDLAALLSGDVEFNFGVGPYQIGAAQADRPIVNVLNMLSRNLIGVVISKAAAEKSGVKPDAPLAERARALKGLRIGMTQPGSLTHRQVEHLMRIGGLHEGEVEIVALGAPASLVSSFDQGRIDGYAISTPHDRLMVQRGKAVMWVDNANGDDPSIDPFVMSGLVVAPKTLADDPETVHRMVTALRKAMDDIRAKPTAEIAQAIREIYEKVDPDTLDAAIEATKKAINPTGRVSRQMWVNTLKLDGREVDPDKLVATFDDRFLK
jgi:NitT/TauT family transport system substrate-binding protein